MIACLVLFVTSAVGQSQETGDRATLAGFPVTSPVKGTLAALQDSWEQWDAAYLLAEEKEADRAVRLLLETAADLGMKGLPDLSLSVLLRSIESAEENDFHRAAWTFAMAERLDPERRQREASYERIERAVTTGFLLHGTTAPRELTQLVDENLLRPGDLYDSAGHRLVYGTSEDGFTLEPSRAGENLVGEQGVFSYRRDFLLDDDFLEKAFPSDRPPLALRD